MNSLREIQEYFQAYMLSGDERIVDQISSEIAPVKNRLDIYRNGYFLRLLDVIEKDFPCLKQIQGEELFNKIGREYIDAYTSDHFSVCYFNRHFSTFLRESKQDEFYAELADFEWALTRVLDAADGQLVVMDDLATIPGDSWPYLQFAFHPSVQIHSFHYNVAQIGYAIMFEQEIPERQYVEDAVKWMIWRFDHNSYFESLNEPQLFMVNAIQEGKNFSEICEGLCKWFNEEEVAQFAVSTLQYWIQKEILSEVKVQSTPIVEETIETDELIEA